MTNTQHIDADSPSERAVDGVVQGLNVIATVIAVVALMIIAIPNASRLVITSLVIYGLGFLATSGTSAAYHLASRLTWKEGLRRVDHAAIFLMIGGTYTPFALVSIGGVWGYGLCVAVWVVALFGIAVKLLLPRRYNRASVALYLALGWSVLLALNPLLSAVSVTTLALLCIGGVLYSTGVVFHLLRRLPYQNAIWHLFVMVAALCHYAAVVQGVALA